MLGDVLNWPSTARIYVALVRASWRRNGNGEAVVAYPQKRNLRPRLRVSCSESWLWRAIRRLAQAGLVSEQETDAGFLMTVHKTNERELLLYLMGQKNKTVSCQLGLEDEVFGIKGSQTIINRLVKARVVRVENLTPGTKGKQPRTITLIA